MSLRNVSSTNKSQKKSGGCSLAIFGIGWTLFSSIFFILGLQSIYDGLGRTQWPEVPCELIHFKVQANKPQADPPFQPKVKYTYQWEGKSYTSHQVWPNKDGEEKYEALAELIEKRRNNDLTKCYINPEAPEESALIITGSDTLEGIVPTIIGGLFMAIGIGLIISGRREKKKKTKALSSQSNKNDEAPAVILVPFFSVFALAGFGVLIFVVLPAGQKYFAAQSWQETPAKVIWSTVRSSSDSDGTTYSVDIFYRYTFNGQSYRSNTREIMSSSSSGRSAKQKIVKAHPRGKDIICYVNPENPWQAVMERKLGWSGLFALFPLPFIAIGVGGLWWVLRSHKKKNVSVNPYQAETPQTKTNKYPKPHKEFAPRRKRILALTGTVFFTTFWCGITSVFVTIAVKSWLRNDPEWFLTIFITPFVLVGIGSIFYSTYRFFAVFSPAPTIKLKPASISMDGTAKVTWKVSGGIGSIRHFSIYLIGEEEATYRQGTDTKTATEIFYEQELTDTSDSRNITRGSASIDFSQLSTPIMPSWKGTHNRIKWSLLIIGKVKFWPDIRDDYEVEVQPTSLDQ